MAISGALCAGVSAAPAPQSNASTNGSANSANSGANKASNNGKSQTSNGLAKGHDKQLAELMQEFDACFSAGEAGDVLGYNNAARLLMAGDKDFTNLDSALAILDRAIKLGSSEAKYLKGALLIGQETDVSTGLNYVMEAARADYADAQLLLARLYKEGKYLPEDNQLAAEWAKYAADLGLPSANVDFARLTLKKTAATGEDDETALKRLVDAADQNNARAALEISRMYLSQAQRTAADCDDARKYAQIAFDNGLAEGAFLMAVTYLPDDPDTALDWLHKGISQNDWKCLYANGLMIKENKSVAEAVDMASKVSRKTAMNYAVSSQGANTSKTTPWAVRSYILPKIPAALRGLDMQVEIKLQFTINREGIPTGIQVLNPSQYDVLNTVAVDALAQWRFNPATINGRPVPAQVVLPVIFKPAQ